MSQARTVAPWVEETPAHMLVIEKTEAMQDVFAIAGPELFMVGDQHGGFPPMGYHISGEMGGIWTHPVKLLDGLWLTVRGTGGEVCLDKATRFVVGPGVCEHHQEIPEMGLQATRREWVTDAFPGLVVEYHIKNVRDIAVPLEIELKTHVNLRPCWKADELQIRDGQDLVEYHEDDGLIFAEDEVNGWALVLGTNRTPLYCQTGCSVPGRDNANGAILMFAAHIEPCSWFLLRVFLASSTKSIAEASDRYKRLCAEHESLLVERAARYMESARRSRAKTGNDTLDRAILWARMGYESLGARLPAGNGMVAGYPDNPWFCAVDMCLAVGPALVVGRPDLAKENLSFLADLARKAGDDPYIPLEVTPMGPVADRAHQQITLPLFINALRTYFDWTGDRSFVQQCFPIAEALVKRVPLEATGFGLLPTGGGMIEKPTMVHRCVDTVSLLLEAMRNLADLEAVFGTPTLATYCKRRVDDIEAMINLAFWHPELKVYADMLAPAAVLERIVESSLGRAKGAAPQQVRDYFPSRELKGTPDRAWTGRHWTTVLPLAVGAASPAQAEEAFARLETGEYIASWGMMGQAAMDRKVNLLATSFLACAQARYGRLDASLQTMRRIALSLGMGMPGAFAQYLPTQGSCMRSWAGYGLIWAFAHHIMGIRPALGEKRLDFMPRLPPGCQEIALDNVRVGDLTASFRCHRVDESWVEASIAVESFSPAVLLACPVAASGEVEVLKDGYPLRKWDTEEKTVDGQRYVGVRLPMAPGIHSVRVRA